MDDPAAKPRNKYDQWMFDTFGVDPRDYEPGGPKDPAKRATAPAPPAAAHPPPPAQGSDPWAAVAAQRSAVAKQVASLTVLGSPAASGFGTALASLEQQAAAGKSAEAAKGLSGLAQQVKAEFDKQRAPRPPTPEEVAQRKLVADKVTATAGHGTEADTKLVVDQLAKMPKGLLDALEKNGTKVKVCRGSVTDYLTDLKGVKPRGWPEGMTWDSVPGLQRPQSKEVVIATVGQDTGNPHVPKTGEGHGSVNLVIHESAHGVDYAASPHVSTTKPFTDARNPDKGALAPYETQPDPAGPEETFAESCARFYADDPFSAESTPHLHKYWRDNPIATG